MAVIIFIAIMLVIGIITLCYFYFSNDDCKYKNQFQEEIKKIADQATRDKEIQLHIFKQSLEKDMEFIEAQYKGKKEHYDFLSNEYLEKANQLKERYEKEIEEEAKLQAERINMRRLQADEEINRLAQKEALTRQQCEDMIAGVKEHCKEEEEQLLVEITKRRQEVLSLITQFKKDEEARKENDFYRVVISDKDKEDIKKLKNFAESLHNPTILYKLIWKEYYEKPFKLMVGRTLGTNQDKSGIYKITNISNQMAYIGQSSNLGSRLKQHFKRGVRAENVVATNSKLYNALWEEGLENFTYQPIEFCSKEDLNVREKFYIDLYQSDQYGYNSTKGGS